MNQDKIAVATLYMLAKRYQKQSWNELECILPEVMPPLGANALRKWIHQHHQDLDNAPDLMLLESTVFGERAGVFHLSQCLLELSPKEKLSVSGIKRTSGIEQQWGNTAFQCEIFDHLTNFETEKYSKIVDFHSSEYEQESGMGRYDSSVIKELGAYDWLSRGIGEKFKIDNNTIAFLKIASLVLHLTKDGKAMIEIPLTMWNMYPSMKEFLFSQGCIESMIILTDERKEYRREKFCLLIFHAMRPYEAQNQKVSMYDMGENGWKWLVEHVESVQEALHQEEHQYSWKALQQSENSSLSVRKGQVKEFLLKDVLVQEIRRGVRLRETAQLSNEKTNLFYLNMSDISDGILWTPESYLDDSSFEKSPCILEKKNVLLVSRIGTVSDGFKTAVFQPSILKKKERILVGENFYMVVLDESKVNIFYIQAYLESHVGRSLLSEAIKGKSVPVIGIDSLENLRIPAYDLETQCKIGEGFRKEVLKKMESNRKKYEELRRKKDSYILDYLSQAPN